MASLRSVLVLAALLVIQTAGAARQEPAAALSPRNASYTLAARLDPAARVIEGSGRIRWRNITASPAAELRLHLYWNAWRDPGSTWLAEQRLGLDADLALRPLDDYGWIDVATIARVTPAGPVNLRPDIRYIAPDDGNREDRTLLSVPLDRPVGPGETIELDVTWSGRVPRTYARTGVLGDYFLLAHWFPKVAVLDDDGWNSHQSHAAAGFFSDFGVYDVRVTVPSGWIVGATGREAGAREDGGGQATHRYVQEDVHDFAWATSPDFIERRERFASPGLPPVDVRLLLQPAHAGQANRYFAAARTALERYGRWLGPYPYAQLTIVDPVPIVTSSQGRSTGAVAYPTLVTGGTRWCAPRDGPQPERVTIREIGRHFFSAAVAPNGVEHAWMDAGLAAYASARVMAAAMPERVLVERYFGGLLGWSYGDVPWSRAVEASRLSRYRAAAGSDVPATPTWRYWPGTASRTSDDKTALWLATLERHLGWPVLQRALSDYVARDAFRHPGPDALFEAIRLASGHDLEWFVDQVYRDAATFDYAIDHVQRVGTYDTIVNTVVVRRHGEGVFPVDLRVRFSDGTETIAAWDGGARWRAFTFERRALVTEAELDPDHVLLLDLDRTNNSWTANPRGAEAAAAWSWRWMTWAEELLLTYAFFA